MHGLLSRTFTRVGYKRFLDVVLDEFSGEAWLRRLSHTRLPCVSSAYTCATIVHAVAGVWSEVRALRLDHVDVFLFAAAAGAAAAVRSAVSARDDWREDAHRRP
jgi:hypothetical protein